MQQSNEVGEPKFLIDIGRSVMFVSCFTLEHSVLIIGLDDALLKRAQTALGIAPALTALGVATASAIASICPVRSTHAQANRFCPVQQRRTAAYRTPVSPWSNNDTVVKLLLPGATEARWVGGSGEEQSCKAGYA